MEWNFYGYLYNFVSVQFTNTVTEKSQSFFTFNRAIIHPKKTINKFSYLKSECLSWFCEYFPHSLISWRIGKMTYCFLNASFCSSIFYCLVFILLFLETFFNSSNLIQAVWNCFQIKELKYCLIPIYNNVFDCSLNNFNIFEQLYKSFIILYLKVPIAIETHWLKTSKTDQSWGFHILSKQAR